MNLDPSSENPPKVLARFLGLNNVADPMRGAAEGTWGWQSVADNVNGTDSGGMERREGIAPAALVAGSSITGSYSTFDFSRLYIIDSGTLKRVYPDGTTTTLYGMLSGAAYWSEQNDVVYLSCGSAKIQIGQDNSVASWGVSVPDQPNISAATGSLFAGFAQAVLTYTDATGREGGACPAVGIQVTQGGFTLTNIPQIAGYTPQLYCTEPDGNVFMHVTSLPSPITAYTVATRTTGRELTTQFLDVPPEGGSYIAFAGAQALLAEYIPEIDQTVVWTSEEMGYHLFNLNSNYFVVPGEVTQMYGKDATAVITTQTRVFAYSDSSLKQIAEYGAVPGQHADMGSDDKIYFWTKRGLCRAVPFENLTESHFSAAPGVYAGGGVINQHGYSRYVAVLHRGGDAFNQR
jgi:hypothetical protein